MICKILRRVEDALREWRIRRIMDRMLTSEDWQTRRMFYSLLVDEIHARSADQIARMERRMLGKNEIFGSF